MLETMRDSAYYSIYTLAEFKNSIRNLYGQASVTHNPDYPTSPLTDGQWGWDSNGEYAHIKDIANMTGYAGFTTPHTLYAGDMIEIEGELFSISGVLPKISIDRVGTGAVDNLQVTQAGKWETVKLNFLVRTNGQYHIMIGTWSAEVAEFRVRNIRIRTKSSVKQMTQKDNYRTALIVKTSDGSWSVHKDFASDPCTVVVDSTNKWITVTFQTPLVSSKNGIAFIGNESYPTENSYMSKSFASYKDRVMITFYNSFGTTRIDPATLPVDTRLTILLIGSLNSFA